MGSDWATWRRTNGRRSVASVAAISCWPRRDGRRQIRASTAPQTGRAPPPERSRRGRNSSVPRKRSRPRRRSSLFVRIAPRRAKFSTPSPVAMFPLRNFRPAAAAGERGSVDTQKTCKCVPHKTCVARAKRRQSDRAFFSVRVWGRFWRACARRPQWAPSRCALVSPSPAGLRRELSGVARGDDSAAKTLTPRRRPPCSVDPGFASGEWPFLERSRGTFREVGGSPANAEPKRRLKKYITDKRVFSRVLKYRA